MVMLVKWWGVGWGGGGVPCKRNIGVAWVESNNK